MKETKYKRFEQVKNHPKVKTFIAMADKYLESLGYTEHGFRHTSLVSEIAENILERLGYSEREIELAKIAAYLHDIGNFLGRDTHTVSGALIAMDILKDLGFPPEDIGEVIEAIANHDEKTGFVATPITAAVVLADKSDAHRSRVRAKPENFDIHDRVNYAVEKSFLRVDEKNKEITLELTIDTEISKPMEYFEIFLSRMLLCRQAAKVLGCEFHLEINKNKLL
ncbi:MAG: phosphohydrolase [Caldiserica bacterium]|nr:MAG: phosphohydrolase [Caldisericota bacterium]